MGCLVNWLGTAANVAQILSVLGPFIVVLFWVAVKINKKLDVIDRESKPNGGSSMRDALNRILYNQEKLDERLDNVERNLANMRGAFDEHTKNRGSQ